MRVVEMERGPDWICGGQELRLHLPGAGEPRWSKAKPTRIFLLRRCLICRDASRVAACNDGIGDLIFACCCQLEGGFQSICPIHVC